MPDDMGLVAKLRAGLQHKMWDDGHGNKMMSGGPDVAAANAAMFEAAAAIERLLAERDEARRANERDRTIIIDARNSIHDAIVRRSWLLEGRGSYEWDDERYRQEFSAAIDEIGKPLETLERLGIDWTNCPTDQAEIARARQALQDSKP